MEKYLNLLKKELGNKMKLNSILEDELSVDLFGKIVNVQEDGFTVVYDETGDSEDLIFETLESYLNYLKCCNK